MAVGNAQLISPILDDINRSTRTTYSSLKIEDILGTIGGNAVVYLTIASSAPTSFSDGDYYYNSTTNLIHQAKLSAWGTGSSPKMNTLYVDKTNKSIYMTDAGILTKISSGTTAAAAVELKDFKTNVEYVYKELVTYNQVLYRINKSPSLKVVPVTGKSVGELLIIALNNGDIIPAEKIVRLYEPNTVYPLNNLVIYNNKIYRAILNFKSTALSTTITTVELAIAADETANNISLLLSGEDTSISQEDIENAINDTLTELNS